MPYATLMVHLELGCPNQNRLELAGELAGQFGAKVIGVAAGELTPSAYFVAGRLAAELIEESRRDLRRRLRDLEEEFRAAMKGQAEEFHWRSALNAPTPWVLGQSHAADLIIVGSQQDGDESWSKLDCAQLLMGAGRPILMTPPERRWLRLQSVLIAWKDTREARRAIVDAIPMLQRAKNVTVLAVLEEDNKSHVRGNVDDVIAWLASHNVLASTMVSDVGGTTDERIDQVASDLGADLIVAGAYGRGRLKEWIFGGVTKTLISQSRYTTLMSH